ncbi:MAG: penicillin-binding protein 2 [Candidatus Magasanikbacteria bacterium]|nr:penicillin-binding protein 2 [Candidatus Magasanikbacteria bacterium]
MSSFDLFGLNRTSFPNGDLTGKYRRVWTEEAFDIEDGVARGLGINHTKRFLGNAVSIRRLYAFMSIIILCFFFIFGRLIYLQMLRGTWYREVAEENRLRLSPIPAERGIIYDRFNHELVENVPQFTLTITPENLPRGNRERAEIVARLSTVSGVSPEEIATLLERYRSSGYERLVLKDNLDYTTALQLYVQNSDLSAVSVDSGMKRQYAETVSTTVSGTAPLESLGHVLGYVGKLNNEEIIRLHSQGYLLSDSLGKTGLEKTYETILRGIYGRKKIEVNATGKEQTVLAIDPPVPGNNLILTIDARAQGYLEKLIRKSSAQSGHRRIAAVAMDPRNGEILALVNLPTFNNNDFSGGISVAEYKQYLDDPDHPLFNRVIAGTYPPGSTVKLVVAAAALEEGIIAPETTINSTGGIQTGDHLFKDWLAGGHGSTNVIKAIAWSVNTFFYYVGGGYQNFVGLGVDRLTAYMRRFNIAAITGIDLPGERPGFLPSKQWKKQVKGENWFLGDTYNLSIGEGDLLVTPLQVAVWTAAVANGGKVMQPHIGQRFVNPISHLVTPISFKEALDTEINPAFLAVVRQGMRSCVTLGSCQKLKLLPFATGGKTGTAQWNHNKPNHAWFTSFAPYDQPQIVVTVLVEEGGEGSVSALPIARDFLAWWGKTYLTP